MHAFFSALVPGPAAPWRCEMPSARALALAELVELEDLMADLCGASRLGEMARAHLASGGRRLRARLALDAAEALGVSTASAIPWAAACEMLHNATLVHDDLQDGDRVRRGRPTVWALHGADQAILVGDLLLMLAGQAMAACPESVSGEARWQLCRALSDDAAALARGQSAELSMLADRRLSREDYAEAARGKTGALFALPVRGALILAGYGADEAAEISAPFRDLGLLYQILDDARDLYGDKGRGRRGEDLREGKVSALVVEQLRLAPDSADWLLPLLETPRDDVTDAQVQRASAAFVQSGAAAALRRWAAEIRRGVLEAPALAALPALRALAEVLLDMLVVKAGGLGG